MSQTREIAEWASSVRYEDIPPRIHERTKAQIASVVAAIHAGRHSEGATSGREVATSWGGPSEATVFNSGERIGRHNAIYANTMASVSFDFDDYLCFGHTGHSAVCASFAYGEAEGASGRDVLASIAVANEVGGRLGGCLLLGPQNGQMWSYIHVLEGACVASRFLGLDAGRTADAIGIAFTQPPYPLMPAFMGPDSKLLIPATTTVDGCRAAELAARGWSGSHVILEDKEGFLRRYNANAFTWMLSGFGDAWVTDSLCYKIVPGCAYIDTAIDAFTALNREHGPFTTDDIDSISVRCGLLTTGMEGFATSYRSRDRLDPISINFSVALSIGLMLHAGELKPEFFSHKYLDANRDAIEAGAAKVSMHYETEMDKIGARAGEGGTSVTSLLGAQTLAGQDFETYVMAFPSEVTINRQHTALQEVPLGGAGRPWDETKQLVERKFRENFTGDADAALKAIQTLDACGDLSSVASLLA